MYSCIICIHVTYYTYSLLVYIYYILNFTIFLTIKVTGILLLSSKCVMYNSCSVSLTVQYHTTRKRPKDFFTHKVISFRINKYSLFQTIFNVWKKNVYCYFFIFIFHIIFWDTKKWNFERVPSTYLVSYNW